MNSTRPTLDGMSSLPCLDPWKPSKSGVFLCLWGFFLVWGPKGSSSLLATPSILGHRDIGASR